MRLPIVALLLCVGLALGARADPAVVAVGSNRSAAIWTFSEPANYTATDVSLSGAGASLAWGPGSVGDSSGADFLQSLVQANVDVTSVPGDVAIQNLSGLGSPMTQFFQPGPGQLDDVYLWSGGGGNTNFGASPNLYVGYWGANEWNRAILRFPVVLLPENATVLSAGLRLYLYSAATAAPMEISVHAVTQDWLETLATWNDYDGNNNWNASGGDYDPFVVDAVTGITAIPGWYSWNITSLVQGWWTGTTPNHGLLLRQINDPSVVLGRKHFYSSDAANASFRPGLEIRYAAVGTSSGVLESRVLDAGGVAAWRSVDWTGSVPGSASVTLQVRTGNAATVDGSWSAWSPPSGTPGPIFGASPSRYIQYRLNLAATSASPVVHDVMVSYERFAASGQVVPQAFRPSGLVGWGRLAVETTEPSGTSVELAYSGDGGSSWVNAANGEDLSPVSEVSLLVRVRLITGDTTRTPWVHSITLGFFVNEAPGGGTGFQIPVILGVPVWVLLIPFFILAAWTVTRDVKRRPFDVTDLFLIHKDGRLIHRAGGEDGPVKDEDAVSGMFTVVAEFVKDSFGGGADGRGDLKHFRVDNRDVAVAKVDYLFLALVGRGTMPPQLDRNMRWFLRGVSAAHRRDLDKWDGLIEDIGDVPWALDWFLAKGSFRRLLWPRRQFRCG